jgi:uncharacterized protein YgiM (DUF1202 family)
MISRTRVFHLIAIAAASAAAGSSLIIPSYTLAAPAAVAGDASPQPYVGILNDDNVYVRSGPSDVYYATTKLPKGAKVTVVAIRNDWLKILPPAGSYSYVAKAYVMKTGDGTTGKVTKSELNVRAGSTLNGLKTTVQTSLQEGEDVKILGEQDDYFKITPPAGAYLYVKKTLVDAAPQEMAVVPPVAPEKLREPIASDPVPAGGVIAPEPVTAVSAPAPAQVVSSPVAPAQPPVVVLAAKLPPAVPATMPSAVAVAPATQPAAVAMVAPATQPAEPTAEAKFDTLESAFLDATGKPLEKQPIDSLLKQYTALNTDPALPSSMQRIAEMRIATLKLRADARDQYVSALKLAAEAKSRQVAFKAEQDELAQRVKEQQVTMYTAVGTLRTSSLQQTGSTMYRLTDPGTGRTLLYVRSNDPKYAGLLNQFIGVKGDIAEDTNVSLKILTPTDAEAVDQSKVNTNISATVMPPSLLPKTAAAIAN